MGDTMTQTSGNEEIEFAFGDNEIDGVCCPAIGAGYAPNKGDVSTEVAEMYDQIAEEHFEQIEGTAPSHEVGHCWKEAVQRTEEKYGYSSELAEAAREIADHWGWL